MSVRVVVSSAVIHGPRFQDIQKQNGTSIAV
jgi:hypothetical protein